MEIVKPFQLVVVENQVNDLLLKVMDVKHQAYKMNQMINKLLKENAELSANNPFDGYNFSELRALKKYVDLSRKIEIDLSKYEENFIESVKVIE